MFKYSLRWIQLQPRERPEPYDWKFVLKECTAFALIGLAAWWIIWAVFPWALS
jgi:hypothetical protein